MGTDLLELTAELVAIASPSHGEAPLVDHLQALLGDVPGLVLDRVGDNLVARTQLGRAHRFILAGHTDTVPANGNQGARRDGDVLWGLGSTDMKAGLAVMVELARTVLDPAVDVTYVFYACEEVAARHSGLLQLLEQRPELLHGDLALLGEPTDGVIEAGCQGTMRVRLTLGGTRAHTARPWMGRNAVHRLAPVLARLAAYDERQPVIDGCTYHEAMQAVAVEGGVGGNVVPDRVVLTVNHRFAPDRNAAEAEAHVRAVLGVELDEAAGDAFVVVDVAAGAPPSLGHPVLARLIERHQLPVRAKLGWTDVAFFARHGIPAANFGPGDPELAHTADERVHREPVQRVHDVLEDLLRHGL